MNTTDNTEAFSEALLDSFASAQDFNTLAAALQLPPRLWDIALAADGRATAADIARQLCLPEAAVLAGLRRLERDKLVSKVLIPCPWSPASGPAPRPEPFTPSVAERPSSAATEPGPEAKVQTVAPARPAEGAPRPGPRHAPVKLALKGRGAAKPAKVALKVLGGKTPKPAPATAAAAPGSKPAAGAARGGRKIQPVLDALRHKAGGDPMVGQLLAYRVFLRVPGNLLLEAGIRSVCLIEPDLEVFDPRLVTAIDKALAEVAGISWPEASPAAA